MSLQNTIDLRIFIAILRRRFLIIAAIFISLMIVAITAISVMKDEFTAESRVLLDKKVSGSTILELSQMPQLGLDRASIESEIELLHSQTVMDGVIELLTATTEASEGNSSTPKVASGIDALMQKYKEGMGKMSSEKPTPQCLKEPTAETGNRFQQYQALLRGLAVSRVGDSYVLRIRYTAHTPELAARVANAFADAYITEQRRVLATQSDQTLNWFQSKLDELKKMAQKADKAVADFRLQYNTQIGSETSLNQLNVLVKESETYHQILNDYLDRYETLNQESSFPVGESRVISQALPPPDRSHPKTPILLGVAAIVSLGLGIIVALFIDLNEKSIRRAGQLRTNLALPFIGFVPRLRFWQQTKMQPQKISTGETVVKEQQCYALQNPQNDYAVAVRGMAAQLTQCSRQAGFCLGMTNMDSSSASRQLMYNLSEYLAIGKSSCIYIDADFTYSNDPKNQSKGWINLLAGEVTLDDVLLKSSLSELNMLPAGYAQNIQSIRSFSSDSISLLFEQLAARYDFIVINLPDLKKSADLHIITPLLDACFINLKWGKTTLQSTQFYLEKAAIPANKLIGTLLCDTHLGKLKRHYGYDA